MSENGVYINPLDGCAIFANINYLDALEPAENHQTFKASKSLDSQSVVYGENLSGQFALSEDGLIRPPEQDWYRDLVTDAHWPAASLEVSADPPYWPGAAGHCIGTCKPCVFYHTETACKFVERCHFCHLCPPGETKKRRHIKIRRYMDMERMKRAEAAKVKPAPPEPVPENPVCTLDTPMEKPMEPPTWSPVSSSAEEEPIILESDPLKEYLQQLMAVPSSREARNPSLGSLGSLDTCWSKTGSLKLDEWPELVMKTLLIYDKKSSLSNGTL